MTAEPASSSSPRPHPHRHVPWWPPLLGFLTLGLIYLLLPERYSVGPRWSLLGAVVFLIIPFIHVRRKRRDTTARLFAVAMSLLVTLSLMVSVIEMIFQFVLGPTKAVYLLRDAALIWFANILVFALWYWELDGGGALERHRRRICSTDFAFPQMQLGSPSGDGWAPHFVDYLFVAFNTSTAFSPTDTIVLARRAKVLMMVESLISLLTIAVIAARAVNTLSF